MEIRKTKFRDIYFNDYTHVVMVDRPNLYPWMLEGDKWRRESKVPCLISGQHVYFKNEKDAMFFMLRWA